MTQLVLIPNDFSANQALFLSHKQRLDQLLQNFETEIEHVGSTAIPETIGKGIIDIIIACENEEILFAIRDILVSGGYRQGELGKTYDGRLFFCNVEGKTQAGDIHLHLVVRNSTNHLEVIQFRDYLLSNPNEVVNYNQEKLRLAEETKSIREEYVARKGEYITQLLARI